LQNSSFWLGPFGKNELVLRIEERLGDDGGYRIALSGDVRAERRSETGCDVQMIQQ
jgi:hypothetical protein